MKSGSLATFLSSLQTGLSLEAFAERYPQPALLLWISEEALDQSEVLRAGDTVAEEGVRALLGGDRPRDRICFLEKSERNPFANIISLGRADTNDICVPSQQVSKVHAVFMQLGGSWKVGDRGARNGLLVDHRVVPPGGSVPLEDGAVIGFGAEVEATFHTPAGLFRALFR